MRNTFLEIFISLKNQKKNPNGSELQVKTNVCIFYTPTEKNNQPTNTWTGQCVCPLVPYD